MQRSRTTQNKVHVPSSARENQYLLTKFPITDELIAKFADVIDDKSENKYQGFYEKLSEIFFKIADKFEIDNCHIIANDKFPRIRFSPHKLTAETEQQILFLYNPKFHFSQNSFFDATKRAKKVTLVFLANGEEVRLNAAKFHQQVMQAIAEYTQELGLAKEDVRICDHQHLTFDLYAKDKGLDGSHAHKFRPMRNRYEADSISLPDNTDALTYAIVDIPVNRRIRNLVTLDDDAVDRYTPLYNFIADALISSAKKHNLNNGAVIANGLIPIVRRSENEVVVANGDLQMLGYNPKHNGCGYTCKWSANKLVDTIQFVFVASEQNKTTQGFGKFYNQIELALRSLAEKLEFEGDKEQMVVRFHQHIGFYVE